MGIGDKSKEKAVGSTYKVGDVADDNAGTVTDSLSDNDPIFVHIITNNDDDDDDDDDDDFEVVKQSEGVSPLFRFVCFVGEKREIRVNEVNVRHSKKKISQLYSKILRSTDPENCWKEAVEEKRVTTTLLLPQPTTTTTTY